MANFEVTRTGGDKVQVAADRMEMGPNGTIIFLNRSRVAANGAAGSESGAAGSESGAAGSESGAVNLVRCFAAGAWVEVLDQTANVRLPSGR